MGRSEVVCITADRLNEDLKVVAVFVSCSADGVIAKAHTTFKTLKLLELGDQGPAFWGCCVCDPVATLGPSETVQPTPGWYCTLKLEPEPTGGYAGRPVAVQVRLKLAVNILEFVETVTLSSGQSSSAATESEEPLSWKSMVLL